VLAVLQHQTGISQSARLCRLVMAHQPLDENFKYENELSSDFLAQVALAGTRF